MFTRTVSAIIIALLLTSTLTLAFNIQPVKPELSPLTVPEESATTKGTVNLASQEIPTTEWNRTYGGTSNDYAQALVQTSDGGYALAGYTNSFSAGNNDFWLVKTDAAGNMMWNRTYGGTDNNRAYALVQTKDGGYALAGITQSFGAGITDFWLVKTNVSGNVLWNKTYGGTGNDRAYALVQTMDGGYAMVGQSTRWHRERDFWLIKTDASGNAQWNKTYGGTNNDFPFALVETADGGYALAGETWSFGFGKSYLGDAWLVKTDASGNMMWNRTYGGTGDDEAHALVQTTDGGYALAGYTGSFGAGNADFWLIKTDASGNMQWNRTCGGTSADEAYALVQTNDGGYAMAGLTTSFGAGYVDFWLVKIGWTDFAVRIVGYTLSLDPDYTVNAVLNVTMLSPHVSSREVTCCLVLVDTTGNEVYNNFAGIGGPQDNKNTLVENNTITSVQFTFQLQEPRPGKYAYTISIWSSDKSEMYDSTDWILAFDVPSTTIYASDLGTLYADSYLQDNHLILLVSRFELVNYTFRLADSVTDLSVKVFTVPDSEFRCSLNVSNAQMDLHGEILPHFNVWHNVPANTYEMSLEMESVGANLVRVVIQAGPRIETPSVKIIGVEPTSIFATPGGTMNYKIDVGFNVTTYDDLLLTATLGGQVLNHTYAVEPFKSNTITAYMQVDAPSEIGQYTVDFNASLLSLGIFDPSASASLSVVYESYNIMVSPTVRYYQESLRWSIFTGQERGYVDSQYKLKSLSVTDIKISGVDERDPQTGKPTVVSISFDAANKEKDVHHVVYIRVGSGVYQLGAVIGGDKSRRMEAHNIPVVNDKVSFTILYRKWTFGNWVAEVGTKIVKTVVGLTVAAAVPGGSALLLVPDVVTQMAKYTMLYTAQIWMEEESAYMTIDDATRIIENSGIQQSVFAPFLGAAFGITHNPFHAFLAAVDFLHDSGKMSGWNYARAYIAAFGYILGKASSRLLGVMAKAALWMCLKLEITNAVLQIVKNEMGKVLDPGRVLKAVGGIIDGAKAIWNAMMILVSPSEEGKEVSEAQIGPDPAVKVDPVISMSFKGQIDYTNDTCFGDTLSMDVSFNQTGARAILEVDRNLTAVYLAMLSDSVCRSGILSSFGFNATQTSLEWRSEDSVFIVEAMGSPYDGLIGFQFWMNSSYVQGTQTMSTEASQIEDTAWLNGTLSYPFGRDLNNCISVFLPPGSQILNILPSDNCTIEGSTLTWNYTVDTIAIEFIPPSVNVNVISPQPKTYYSNLISLTFEIDKTPSWIGYSIDSEPNATINGSTIINVEDGAHQIVIYANDTFGNMGSSTVVYFTVNSSFYDPWKTSFIASGGYPIVNLAIHDGKLYAASDNTLYTYDNSSWNVIYAPAYLTSLVSYNGKLIVGGQGGLYSYDGTAFTMILQVPTYIRALGVYNNTIYSGTFLDNPPTLYYCNSSVDNPSDWYVDTKFWEVLNFSGPFGSIDSFAVYSGKMYVASGNTVYSFDGTSWTVALSYEYAYAFLDMQVYNGKLYLATRDQNRIPLYLSGTGFSGVIIEFDGENWTTILGHDYWIYSLEEYDGKLYVGTENRIYTFNGTFWDVSFYSAEGAYYAISMITYDGKIYAGMGNGYIFADPAPPKANPETIIVPEFPSTAILAASMAITVLVTVLTRKKRARRLS